MAIPVSNAHLREILLSSSDVMKKNGYNTLHEWIRIQEDDIRFAERIHSPHVIGMRMELHIARERFEMIERSLSPR
jgi:hypothetical protein